MKYVRNTFSTAGKAKDDRNKNNVEALSLADLELMSSSRLSTAGSVRKTPVENEVDSDGQSRAATPVVEGDSLGGIPENPNLTVEDMISGCKVCYEAESPDEAALVYAAQSYKMHLLQRSPNSISIGVPHYEYPWDFKILHVFPFNSDRKRMSIVVRHPKTGKIVCYTKGADSTILDIVRTSSDETEEGVSEEEKLVQTRDLIDQYSRTGLRTLCIARKLVSEEEYTTWLAEHRNAEAALEDRESLLEQSYENMERDLELLGATGIEDRLQDQVPETIQSLREAGLRVWVITGDKVETAINIGHSCRLLNSEDYPINLVRIRDKDQLKSKIQHEMDKIINGKIDKYNNAPYREVDPKHRLRSTQSVYVKSSENESNPGTPENTEKKTHRRTRTVAFANSQKYKEHRDSAENMKNLGTGSLGTPESTRKRTNSVGFSNQGFSNDENYQTSNFETSNTRTINNNNNVVKPSSSPPPDYSTVDQSSPTPAAPRNKYITKLLSIFKPFCKSKSAKDSLESYNDEYKVLDRFGREVDVGLIVDGKTLKIALDPNNEIRTEFLRLSQYCRSVLICRATPKQKGEVVKLVKNSLKVQTLAIGDGANDVSMIQVADIGVGISGLEGLQAVMTSDFAIPKFKYLKRLLLVHGHWTYYRLGSMVLYFFYKNVAFVLVPFWFQFVSGFGGANPIDDTILMTFNLLFNSLPPLIQGIADQNLEATTLMRHSHLYQQGVKDEVYLPRSFWLFWLMGCYQSLVAFWIVFASYYDDGIDYLSLGWVTTTIVLAANLISQGIEYKTWTVFHWASNIGSFIVYIVFSYFYCEVKLLIPVFIPSSYGIFDNLFDLGQFWLTCLLGTALCVLPHLAIRAVQNDLFPTKSQAARLEERKQKPVEPSVLRNCFW